MKPEWCPEDIWSHAIEAVFECGTPVEAVARAITAEREACAAVADKIGAGRSRQCSEAKSAKKRTEARDFESMAMSAIDVGYAIRNRGKP